MTIRDNIIRKYIDEAFILAKLRFKLRRLSRRMSTDEQIQAERAVNDLMIAWLHAGCPEE